VGAIDWFGPCVWGVFGVAVRCVLKLFESFCDVPRHGDVDGGSNVVPVEGHGEIKGSVSICCDGVNFCECSDEVNGVIAVCVFNAKIVDDKGKCDISCGVGP
jgi:hypothetical protein